MSSSDKKTIRQVIIARRDSLHAEVIEAKSELIKKRLFSLVEFQQADTVLFYASFRSEVSTHQMIKESLEAGKKIALPRIANRPHGLELFRIKDFKQDLDRSAQGILEPLLEKTDQVSPGDIGLAVIPGVTFDERGYRLGYGGGYFDRLLARFEPSVPIIGLAFELQIVEPLPISAHDLPVRKIITEKRVIDCPPPLRSG